jgi:hypothetical protein
MSGSLGLTRISKIVIIDEESTILCKFDGCKPKSRARQKGMRKNKYDLKSRSED